MQLPPAHVRAAFWMVLSGLGFTLLWVLIRLASGELHPFALVVWSNLLGLLWLGPMLLTSHGLFRLGDARLHLRRAGFGVFGLFALFYAVAHAPLAEVLAIGFAAPVFATIGAMLFLKARPGWIRGAALLAGMAGLLLVLRPGPEAFPPGILAALLAAGLAAFSHLALGGDANAGDPRATVTWSLLLMTPLSALLALPWWHWPEANLWPILFAMGACAAAGHLGLARALHLADESRVLPFEFVRFALTALAGIALFRERYPLAVLAGGGILLIAALVLAFRARLLRAAGGR